MYFHVLRVRSQRSRGGLSFSTRLPILFFFELKPDMGLKLRVALGFVSMVDVAAAAAALIDAFEPEKSD